ncbi:alpha-2-macroglobulin family protein [Maribacter sp. 2304DJ31-5]|uniref:alpha-2-macroglobulin family protein n=1 Tax=Maribacter sp. 2304DJ31-5 TaxID=3386273 RepID=UPI0039BD443E
MKLLIATFTIVLFSQIVPAQEPSKSYDTLWEQVFSLETEVLTKSALEVVNTINTKAKKEGNGGQIIKSLLFTSKYALILEEDAQLKVINDLKQEIKKAQSPVSNIMESYLGKLYWQYFQRNRYQFYNRTATSQKIDSIDFRTWDLTMLFKEISIHFEKSLENPELLQKTELSKFQDIIDQQEGSENYRSTLFDLLAHTALEFYKTGENNIARPTDKFQIDDPELLCEAYSFTQLNIPETDDSSLQLKALKLYQDLIAFHFGHPKLDALVDVDIERLSYIYDHSVFDDRDPYYLEALQTSAKNLKNHEVSALYNAEIAQLFYKQGNTYIPKTNETYRWRLKEAIALCNQMEALFPKSRGTEKCIALKSRIRSKNLKLTTERYIPANKISRLLVNYKNYDELNLTAYKISKKEWETLNDLYPSSKQLEFIKKLKKAKSWTAQLQNEQDYQSHGLEIKMPALPNGQFLIFATPHKQTTEKEDMVFAFSKIQITDLAIHEYHGSQEKIFQVIDRNNGGPKKGAKVTLYYKRTHNGPLLSKNLITDYKGLVTVLYTKSGFSVQYVKVEHGGDVAHFGGTYINRKQKPQKESIRYQTFLFKDRSIYRPGQPLYFKGIIIEKDGNSSQLAADETITVGLYDANGQMVTEIDFKTNDYGSFSGEFILPPSGLTGEYYLEIHGLSGIIDDTFYFSVEEYKRPKFETAFNPITDTFKVNDSVTLKGRAKAFAGSVVSGAKVTYRIQRNVNYPQWHYWGRPRFYAEPQEIGHGETITDADGNFEITFKALPDLTSKKEDLPLFNYTVTADVTDINGETQSASTIVTVGYHAVTATIEIDSRLEKNSRGHKIMVNTHNLNGQPVPAKGTVKIYKLKGPNAVLRPRPWPAPDYQNWTKTAFEELFPHDAFATEHDPTTWAKGELVLKTDFDTKKSNEIPLKNIKKWISGQYILELESKDRFGRKVTAKAQTILFSDKEKELVDHRLFEVKTDRPTYTIGDTAEISFYTGSENLTLTYWIEKDRRIVKTDLLYLKKGYKSIKIPVLDTDEGGFVVNYSFSAYNSYHSGSVTIPVPYPDTDLEIETVTFRDKVRPGTDETWSFKIKGPKGGKVSAELLANMYDASLDQFKAHNWYFNPIQKPYYYPISKANANLSFGTINFRNYNPNGSYLTVPNINYDQFEWFGLSFNNSRYAQQRYLRKQRSKLRNTSYWDTTVKEGFVKGTVYDANGQPLVGATILITGATIGVQTDFDGNFLIKAKAGDKLTFSYIGFVSISQIIGKHNVLNIHLREDSSTLDEVVIVGYGTSKREEIVGAIPIMAEESLEMEADRVPQGKIAGVHSAPVPVENKAKMDFDNAQIRKDLQETAFFFPHLTTDKEGNVSFNFTTPEALTRWNLQLLAHTKDLDQGARTLSAVTQKELMVLPNPPRFLREGDTITISGKISNLSNKGLEGFGLLELTDALTGQTMDTILGNIPKTQAFTVDAKGNTQLSWKINIPEGLQAVEYKIMAKAGNFSDGEQNVLPVLTNRMLVTETLPMWVNSDRTKTFTLDQLKDNTSTTLKNHKLTLEITSNPVWYAVQALPYLMEYPYECNEQIFARYYANNLASFIASTNSGIKKVFDQWRNSDALLSNLEKNQELKSLIIQETPWLRDARSETERKKRIALLFDLNKMRNEQGIALRKLENGQLSSGAWPWFQGGTGNRYITQHIMTGLGHLAQLTSTTFDIQKKDTGQFNEQMIKKAIRYLDGEFVSEYERMKKRTDNLSKDRLSVTQIHYLYMRSFFTHIKTPKKVDEIKGYYLGQARRYWAKRNLYCKGMLALVLHRTKDEKTVKKIIRSLKENSIISEELGMYWKENIASWGWYKAPIETQALLIEAFSEIDGDTAIIDNLKIWLLKNKQTNRWKTTKATTEAVYALLLQGSDWLSITDTLTVHIGGEKIEPSNPDNHHGKNTKIEAGTGYFKTTWNAMEIKSEMAEVQLSKKGNGMAWGALYWQYFEDLDKITPAETPLRLKKKLFLKKNTDTGEIISEITPDTQLKVGDLIRVRITLKTDRDMEFIHMKDMRAAGFEPINVLSRYKWQDGLGYYESTKDASTNFFFDHLPKGVYVFEYGLKVNNAGNFSNGITTVQSMYAPEFSSHSEGTRVKIQ